MIVFKNMEVNIIAPTFTYLKSDCIRQSALGSIIAGGGTCSGGRIRRSRSHRPPASPCHRGRKEDVRVERENRRRATKNIVAKGPYSTPK